MNFLSEFAQHHTFSATEMMPHGGTARPLAFLQCRRRSTLRCLARFTSPNASRPRFCPAVWRPMCESASADALSCVSAWQFPHVVTTFSYALSSTRWLDSSSGESAGRWPWFSGERKLCETPRDFPQRPSGRRQPERGRAARPPAMRGRAGRRLRGRWPCHPGNL